MLKLSSLFTIAKSQTIVHATPDFVAAVGDGWLERIMGESITDRLFQKQGRSIARWTVPPLSMYLKRHYVLPRRHGILARLFPRTAWSPGLQEWQHLEWVRGQGLPVPRALAAAEWRGPGSSLQSFLAVEELEGMLPLHEAVPLAHSSLSADDYQLWKRRLVAELARLAVELHRRRAYHKDLYLCHFYIDTTHCRVVPETFQDNTVVIDFHRLGRHRLLARYFQIKDLAQLLYSSLEVTGIAERDRLRFWTLYSQGFAVPDWVRRAVKWKYRLYLRHSRRKAARRLTR